MKNTSWIVAVVIVLLAVAFGVWLSRPSTGAAVVSGHPAWAPVMFQDGQRIVGAGPDLARMVLEEMGVESVSRFAGGWDDVQAAARAGDVDVIVAAYDTDERREYLAYTDAYVTDPIAVFTRADQPFAYGSWEDLAGKNGVGTVGDSYGIALDAFIDEHLTFAVVPDVAEAFDRLEAGEADYVLYGAFAGEREIAAGERNVAALPALAAEVPFHMAVSKRSPLADRVEEMNQLLERLVADGTVRRLMDEYAAR